MTKSHLTTGTKPGIIMSMTRTDPHSPLNLITEDYEYAYAYDGHPEDGDRGACVPIVNMLLAQGYRFASIHGGDTCDHCGARLRYVAVLKHIPSRTLIKVGETCLDNRFSLATGEFRRLRKNAELNRDRMARHAKREAFLREERNAAAIEYLSAAPFNGFYDSLLSQYTRNGVLSARQIDAVYRAIERDKEYAAKKAAEAAAHPGSPVVEGKIVVTGEIISIKLHQNNYGTREVMTVRDDRGFKVWGTQPTSLYDAEVGDRVTFVATVEKSDKDETFGFFKRPTKAAALDKDRTS